MVIEIQETSDNNVINFFPPEPLLKQGSAEFVDSKSIRKSPLAEKIFDINGIASLFITPDMISVTKQENAAWEEMKPLILAEIMDYLSTGEDIIPSSLSSSNDEVSNQIIALLNARIRPAVKKDGGDIKFLSFENGVVLVEMQGACKGCPYAMRTLKDGVERILKTYIPQVKEVRNIENSDN